MKFSGCEVGISVSVACSLAFIVGFGEGVVGRKQAVYIAGILINRLQCNVYVCYVSL